MSKPAVQKHTPPPIKTGKASSRPVVAIQAPMGAQARANPRIKWQKEVKRFV
jgi:hypothetical protein